MPVTFQDRSAFFTTGALGKSRRVTPEGFLVCEGVPIARLGTQVYRTTDFDGALLGNSRGEIYIERVAEEVFRPETIASFEGKPITIEHPTEFVGPTNWARLSVGQAQNVRRGEGIESDLLIADLVITDAAAIAYVNEELPQVSCGYNADYEQAEPGRGIQRNIIGNHVALVKRGRAGARCAIKDGDANVNKPWLTKLLQSLGVKDADTAAEVIEQANANAAKASKTKDGEGEPNALEQRITAIETGFKEIKELLTKDKGGEGEGEGEGDAAATAASKPSVTLLTGDAIKEVISRAEILVPGITLPTADALATAEAQVDFVRKTVDTVVATDEGKELVKPFVMGRDIKALTHDSLLGVFNAAAELKRVQNNQRATRSSAGTKDSKGPPSAEEINQINTEFWAKAR